MDILDPKVLGAIAAAIAVIVGAVVKLIKILKAKRSE